MIKLVLLLFLATHHIWPQMGYSIATVFTDISYTNNGMSVTAITVADTGGFLGHTAAAQVGLFSPDGRSSGAYGSWSYYSEAVTSLALCPDWRCYNGTFLADSGNTEEYCPISSVQVEPAQNNQNMTVPKYLALRDVRFVQGDESPGNGTPKSSLGKSGDVGFVRVDISKSLAGPGQSGGCLATLATFQITQVLSNGALQYSWGGQSEQIATQVKSTGSFNTGFASGYVAFKTPPAGTQTGSVTTHVENLVSVGDNCPPLSNANYKQIAFPIQ